MRLFEAIVEASRNPARRGASGVDAPAMHAEALPAIVLTCIDPRLNALVPEVLGLPDEAFIWTRNAGNIITGPFSSTLRSLALACALKGGKEIAVLGHTDCRVAQTTMLELTEEFRALGVDRVRLPENLVEYFGLFASERQNVLKAVEIIRSSPLIGPRIPVHGLLIEIGTGRLEWLVNGYQALEVATSAVVPATTRAALLESAMSPVGSGVLAPAGPPTFPEARPDLPIGDTRNLAPVVGSEAARTAADRTVELPPGANAWLSEVKTLEAEPVRRSVEARVGTPAPVPGQAPLKPPATPPPEPPPIPVGPASAVVSWVGKLPIFRPPPSPSAAKGKPPRP